MLNVYISSTSRDLINLRKSLLNDFNTAVEGIGMENFVPDGTESQKMSLGRLNEADIVIFLM